MTDPKIQDPTSARMAELIVAAAKRSIRGLRPEGLANEIAVERHRIREKLIQEAKR